MFVAGKSVCFPTEKSREISWEILKVAAGFVLLSLFIAASYAIIAGQSPWKCRESARCFNNPSDVFRRANQLGTVTKETNETKLSHLLFGIGGSAKSWPNRRRYSEVWWVPDTTRGYVWLDEKPNYTWPVSGMSYRVSEDTSQFPYTCWYGSRTALRLARILLESVRLRESGVRWYVMGDDDTVFFTENLVSVLGRYDAEEMYYIGGVSESVEQDMIHSYDMAFGGGGFAISHVLAKVLADRLDGCLYRYTSFYGSDQRIGACINELGVPLTREPGFHQVDIRGDAYGLLAAHPVAPLVSLHHLDVVKPLVPFRTQLDSLGSIHSASRADPGRALQQSFGFEPYRKWSVSVSWGYTVQVYPWMLTAKELGTPLRTFLTWRSWKAEPFTFNTRPWGAGACEQPLVYFLERVEEVPPSEGSGTRSFYRRYKPSQEKECTGKEYVEALKVGMVEVSAPKMSLDEWNKAPRRYCIDINHEIKDRILAVKLRKCRRGESVSPP